LSNESSGLYPRVKAAVIIDYLTETTAVPRGRTPVELASESVAAWERLLIEAALKESRGNKSDAARRLGINCRLLYEKIQQFAV
jgi:two-component system NtrC family response regulator